MKRRNFINEVIATGCGVGLLNACTDPEIKPVIGSLDDEVVSYANRTVVMRNPLKIPPVVSPQGLVLQSKLSVSDLGGGVASKVWTYNDNFPGPTIKASTGDLVTIQLQNLLPEETITHWHGMLVNHENDGHPHMAIPNGEVFNYQYTISQRACLNFYHPHPHMLTGKQVYLGQAGAFVVTDAEEAALGLPSGKYEIPMVIRDATLESAGNLVYKPRSGGFLGQIPLVNGTKDPYLNVDRAVYRFRILNGANSRIFALALSDGTPFTLIGNDGGLLPSSTQLARIDMSNGERTDVLVDFRSYAAGTKIILQDLRSGWSLLEFRVGTTAVNYMGTMITSSIIDTLSNPVTTRAFSFDGMTKINGRVYDMDRIDFQVPFGQTERWRFSTNGNAPHPVHVHGASFQVVSRSGGRGKVFPWEAGWKDTILLEDQETVEVLIKFTAYTGLYLIHCHKLEHEDMGMMSNFEVI